MNYFTLYKFFYFLIDFYDHIFYRKNDRNVDLLFLFILYYFNYFRLKESLFYLRLNLFH
jgi:hypothetical protein